MSRNYLGRSELLQFAEEGVLHLRDVIDPVPCQNALEEISARFQSLGQYEGRLIVNRGSTNNQGPELPTIDNIINFHGEWASVIFECGNGMWPSLIPICEDVKLIAESLQGKAPLVVDVQISMVYPGFKPIPYWHIDGFGALLEGVPLCQLPDFQLLVGVFLTPLPSAKCGNLRVIRGGHKRVQDFFCGPGRDLLHHSSPEAQSVIDAIRNVSMEGLKLESLNTNPGDLVLSHVLTPHVLDENLGSSRPAIYFRVGKYDHPGEPAFTNFHYDWPAVSSALSR